MQEQSIFIEALEREDPAEREAFLDRVCAGDAELRLRVGRLLQRHVQGGSFLESPAVAPDPFATVDESSVTERPGTLIGPYKLMEQIGEGGMGLVFVAEQQAPIRRKVALKVLKPGMDTRQVVARFEAERQALALMDHPHIAQVHDGGVTPSGRPYFVMELVRGTPITQFCDDSRLTTRERLGLFVDVCQAVQHAHQKGIIHRDLKPSNVLVTSHDGTPVVKVIDFGIAKAIGQQLTDKTVYTQFDQWIGTPLYMSPEQAGHSGLDIDTRSDIYALGVLLYELLTGTTPFDRERLQQVGYDELRRIIREEEPPKPSTRLSTLGQAATTVSTHRKSDPKQLSRLLRGELDWLVMKALEKDRNRRYETPSAFAADVRRYLADEPVLACPPSAWYRFRKFARRNKRGLAVAVLVLFCIVVLGFGAGWYQQEQAARALARAERQRETERAVTEAVAQAVTLLAEGDQQTDDPVRWKATVERAELAVKGAEEVLTTGEATEELAGQVRKVRDAVEAARTDIRLLAELDRLQFEYVKGVAPARYRSLLDRMPPRYAELLRGYGVDPAAPEEAAARVRGSRLRETLLEALKDWRYWREQARAERLSQVVSDAEKGASDDLRERLQAATNALGRGDVAPLVRMTDEPELRDRGLREALRAALEDWRRWTEEIPRLEKVVQAAEPAPDGFRARWKAAVRGDFRRDDSVALFRMAGEPEVQRLPPAAILLLARDLKRALQRPRGHTYKVIVLPDAGAAAPKFIFRREGASAAGPLDFVHATQIVTSPAWPTFTSGMPLFVPWKLDLDESDFSRPLLAAVRLLREGQQRYPGDFWLNYELGMVLRAAERVKEAVPYLTAALALRNNDPAVYVSLGNTLDAAGDREEAIRRYQAALRIDPDCISALDSLGETLAAKGDRDGASHAYRALLRINPNLTRMTMRSLLDQLLKAKGDLFETIREYEAGLGQPMTADDWEYLNRQLQRGKRFAEAEKACRQAIAVNEKLVHDFPLRDDYQLTLANSYNPLASLLESLRRDADAEKAYRQAIAVNEKLVHDFPLEHDYRLTLVRRYKSLASLLERLRRDADADQARRRAFDLLEQLPAEFRDKAVVRKELANAYLEHGATLQHTGRRPEEAGKALQQALAHFEKLVGDLPARDRLVTADRLASLGRSLSSNGKFPEAEKAFRLALGLCEKPDPALDAAQHRRQLAHLYLDLADTLTTAATREATERKRRQQEAEGFLRQAVPLFDELARKAPPTYDQDRMNQARCLEQLSNLLQQTGRPKETEEVWRQALAVYEKLAGEFPKNPWHRLSWAQCHIRLGSWLQGAGRTEEAKQAFRAALAVYEKLEADIPNEQTVQYEMANRYDNLSRVLQSCGEHQDAVKSLRRAVALSEKTVAAKPKLPGYYAYCAQLCHNLGDLLSNTKRLKEAEQAYRQAVAVWEGLVADRPTDPVSYGDRLPGLLWAWHKLATFLWHSGQFQEARKAYEQEMLIYQRLVTESPKVAFWQAHLARFLVTCPDLKLRDGPRAVKLAKQAVELVPDYFGRATLGKAHYRAGDSKAALAELERAIELWKEGDAETWFFLAMVHCKLGSTAEARKSYDLGLKWMEKNKQEFESQKLPHPFPYELHGFRAEAEQLLGIKPPAGPKPELRPLPKGVPEGMK
jgi:serine/threonine protein kinase/tetratricopeptide (TPR) repeat protein